MGNAHRERKAKFRARLKEIEQAVLSLPLSYCCTRTLMAERSTTMYPLNMSVHQHPSFALQ